jgi:hypothetical protein
MTPCTACGCLSTVSGTALVATDPVCTDCPPSPGCTDGDCGIPSPVGCTDGGCSGLQFALGTSVTDITEG